ncbi:MAG: DUF86 domain-containing protein [Candidatus Azobacteroides sp.]|nr:DUF86 domain-containing protein [Candidatus Azobacteroides sp.]
MDNEIKKYLHDIQESVCSIENYLDAHLDEHRSFFAYRENKMLRRAIEREFEIIGEAMNRMNKRMPDIPISAKHQIIGLRNRVIHGYDKIDDEIVWGIIIRHLPILKKEIDKLLE